MIRKTTQREAIVEAFKKAQRPLTPAELYELASARAPSLGLRTVYRHIQGLLEEQQIIGVHYPSQPLRYEVVDQRGSRPHFICRACNKTYDLPIEEPAVPFPEVPGFRFEGHEVIFYGCCDKCAQK